MNAEREIANLKLHVAVLEDVVHALVKRMGNGTALMKDVMLARAQGGHGQGLTKEQKEALASVTKTLLS